MGYRDMRCGFGGRDKVPSEPDDGTEGYNLVRSKQTCLREISTVRVLLRTGYYLPALKCKPAASLHCTVGLWKDLGRSTCWSGNRNIVGHRY